MARSRVSGDEWLIRLEVQRQRLRLHRIRYPEEDAEQVCRLALWQSCTADTPPALKRVIMRRALIAALDTWGGCVRKGQFKVAELMSPSGWRRRCTAPAEDPDVLLWKTIAAQVSPGTLEILQKLYQDDQSLVEVGKARGVSKQRIYQIREKALELLRSTTNLPESSGVSS